MRVLPAKPQVSLRIRGIWSVFTVRLETLLILGSSTRHPSSCLCVTWFSYSVCKEFVLVRRTERVKQAALKEKVPSSMRKMCGLTSSCACARSRTGICSPLMHSIESNDSVSGLRRPWSDCADAQSDLGFRCPHMPKDTFSHGATQIYSNPWHVDY